MPEFDPWLVAMLAVTFLIVAGMIFVFYGREGVRDFINLLRDVLWIVMLLTWLAYGYYTPPMPMTR